MYNTELSETEAREKIARIMSDFFPDFSPQVVKDLAHLLYGNALHVQEKITKNGKKHVIVNHQEQVVCLGSGFDWLHLPNFALIVNPVDPDFETPFATQLKVIRANLAEKRIPESEGVLVMISVSYRQLKDKRHSILKAISLVDFAQKMIETEFKDLVEKGLQMIVGIMNEETRLFEPIAEEQLRAFSKSNYSIPEKLNYIGDFVVKHNKAQHEEFTSPYNITRRRKYREEFPTEIMVLKCMDGRIHIPLATSIPMGIIQPMRNIGAKFHFGWKAFYDRVDNWVSFAYEKKRSCLLLISYHFSKLDPHLGCAGHNYDTCAAIRNTDDLVNQARFTLGSGKDSHVSAVKIGFNTDINAMIIHADDGRVFDIEEFVRENFQE